MNYICVENNPSARNKGAESSSSKCIAFLDDDDEWYPDKLKTQLPLINDDVALVASPYVQEGGECPVNCSKNRGSILARNWVGCTSFPLIKSEMFTKVGGFDPLMKANQEWELWMRLLGCGEVAFSDELAGIKHQDVISITNSRSRRRQSWFRLFAKHFKDYLKEPGSFCVALDYCFRDLFRLRAYCSS